MCCAAALRRRRRTERERLWRSRNCAMRPHIQSSLGSESLEGSDVASSLRGVNVHGGEGPRLLASSLLSDATSVGLRRALGSSPAADSPLLSLSSSAPDSSATAAFALRSALWCFRSILACKRARKTWSLCWAAAVSMEEQAGQIAENKAGTLGGEAALEDEQAGEGEGPGWRRWKERTRRWN